ncbi:conjugal transfer protein TrbL family protein [Anaerocolumna chitinilytica]|uniref:Conjugal transfer protein TrbL n=1 Tax=Anaerocolumna chitinilytica TaxID=1727145 RepID=A0A7I8DMZ6_9FIRM|nr:conjugal transfer protein TrbL family protein [Anaerocolumna chitinilytica]BCJ98395.1 hypothetical protein bsdcttw_14360 [Anaerocolumna chitinilytica]
MFSVNGLKDTISNIFNFGFEGFISHLLNEALKAFDTSLINIADISFNAEKYMTSYLGMNLNSLFTVIRLFGLYFIVLKALKKGFDVYILWTDGDSEMDPFILFTGFFKAIALAVSFNSLYGFAVDIIVDFMNQILGSINNVDLNNISLTSVLHQYLLNGIIMMIFAVVYIICYIILYLQFIKHGLEIFVLKLGVPLACVGLMDSDGGVYKAYLKKFSQEFLTVLLQTFMLKLSLALMINGHYMFGMAAIMLSLKAPQFLNEFVMAYSGGPGVVQRATSTAYTANMIRSFVK